MYENHYNDAALRRCQRTSYSIRSSLAPFRIYNRSASSRNHHWTYIVTRHLFARSPLWCFHRKVWVTASCGWYKGSWREAYAEWDKRAPISTSRFAHTSWYCEIPRFLFNSLAWYHAHAYIHKICSNQSRPRRVPGRGCMVSIESIQLFAKLSYGRADEISVCKTLRMLDVDP